MTHLRISPLLFLLPFLLLFAGCASEEDTPEQAPSTSVPAVSTSAEAPAADDAVDEKDAPLVVFLGDSLTAGLGLDEARAFPALLASRLDAEGIPMRVVNAGVSGDTTAGGLRRLDWLLRQDPDVLVLALGGNDGLRGLAPEEVEKNLRQVIERCREAGVDVLLAGMLAPPNLGEDYGEAFREVYPRLAEEEGVALVPFLLEGVAAVPELNLVDGIHPNAEGQARVAENVLPALKALLLAN